MRVNPPPGLSVVICAHNAAQRISPTLEHLMRQVDTVGIAWEVVLVDNGSTDDTAGIARTIWTRSDVPLRIVSEPALGLMNARKKGLATATYGLIGFVDDDNWLAADWVAVAVSIMSQHPEVGICGGLNEAVSEGPLPEHIRPYLPALATGPQGNPGDITESRAMVFGAGMVLRIGAWQEALARGGTTHDTGRVGTAVSGAEDIEICLMVRASGWRIWYEPRLRLQHYLPTGRLQWGYLRRLHRGSATPVRFDGYHLARRHHGPWTLRDRISWSWSWQTARALFEVIRRPLTLLRLVAGAADDAAILQMEERVGRVIGMMRARSNYAEAVRTIVTRFPPSSQHRPVAAVVSEKVA